MRAVTGVLREAPRGGPKGPVPGRSYGATVLPTALGDAGCLSIFGSNPTQHRLFGEHLTAEYRVQIEGRGRTVDEWKLPVHKPDNHWLDCLVGWAAAASMRGVERIGAQVEPKQERKRLKLSELQRQRR